MKETFPETIITVDFGSADTEKQKLKNALWTFSFYKKNLLNPKIKMLLLNQMSCFSGVREL